MIRRQVLYIVLPHIQSMIAKDLNILNFIHLLFSPTKPVSRQLNFQSQVICHDH